MVIATVLLSIIGMSAGLVLGSRHKPGYVSDQPANSALDCPPEMHDTARLLGYDLPMTQVLKVRAASSGTTIWICADPDGRLFYQANRGGAEQRWIEGETALFLAGVQQGPDDYHVTASDGNTFSVNEERLVVVINGRKHTSDVHPE